MDPQPYLKATANYEETATNSSGASQAYTYQFSVFDVLLGIEDWAGVTPGEAGAPTAMMEFIISVSGTDLYPALTPIYTSWATLNGGILGQSFVAGGTNPFVYAADNNDPGGWPNIWWYGSSGASDTLTLGNLADGGMLTLKYSMAVVATAAPHELGAYASFGDPNNLVSTPGVSGVLLGGSGPGPGPVIPLPASAWMGLGLLGCLGMVRLLRRSG